MSNEAAAEVEESSSDRNVLQGSHSCLGHAGLLEEYATRVREAEQLSTATEKSLLSVVVAWMKVLLTMPRQACLLMTGRPGAGRIQPSNCWWEDGEFVVDVHLPCYLCLLQTPARGYCR
ncbi:hypothetical protein HRR95_000751 [Exophiala dermatitidis]|nr:hypothetical protein HRR95_000751 [Exophiala dermatitidis]